MQLKEVLERLPLSAYRFEQDIPDDIRSLLVNGGFVMYHYHMPMEGYTPTSVHITREGIHLLELPDPSHWFLVKRHCKRVCRSFTRIVAALYHHYK
jgi:hypothetical protein